MFWELRRWLHFFVPWTMVRKSFAFPLYLGIKGLWEINSRLLQYSLRMLPILSSFSFFLNPYTLFQLLFKQVTGLNRVPPLIKSSLMKMSNLFRPDCLSIVNKKGRNVSFLRHAIGHALTLRPSNHQSPHTEHSNSPNGQTKHHQSSALYSKKPQLWTWKAKNPHPGRLCIHEMLHKPCLLLSSLMFLPRAEEDTCWGSPSQ